MTNINSFFFHVTQATFWLFGLLEILSILSAHADVQLGFCKSNSVRITLPFLLAWACCVMGALIRHSCYRALGHMFTYEISIQKGHRLVTSGPYAYVRHPSYSSGALAMVGAMTCHLTPGAWLRECSGLFEHAWRTHLHVLAGSVPVLVFFLLIVPRLDREDELMKQQFGEEWVRWATKTPYKLIPGLW
ncbi:hypothetical protein D9619_012719 [Psilocybe cf. subviscida]|uniref:Protein-S-isoprenylcysteine O-methyltransferase n=1 Tax=Psilocybe cf. subviscida TaxID=2480587 RepID=A0A8H5AQP8_9AGAR|nr:hypothetical protein D9619_012719 [Psilocybe cf. subviscida]